MRLTQAALVAMEPGQELGLRVVLAVRALEGGQRPGNRGGQTGGTAHTSRSNGSTSGLIAAARAACAVIRRM